MIDTMAKQRLADLLQHELDKLHLSPDCTQHCELVLRATEWRDVISALRSQVVPTGQYVPEGKWISIADQQPEGDGSVLASGPDPDGNMWREICSAAWLREQSKFATHWMPLPTPPISGESK